MFKRCPRCEEDKEINEDNWYPARPRKNHKKPGWQSYCRLCWREINKGNKLRIKEAGQGLVGFITFLSLSVVIGFIVLLFIAAFAQIDSFKTNCTQAGGTALNTGREHICVDENGKILPVSFY